MTKAKRTDATILDEVAQMFSKLPNKYPLPAGKTEEEFEQERAEEARENELYMREIQRQPD